MLCVSSLSLFFFKQKTAYEMRISDWSSDVCSSDLTNPITSNMMYLLIDEHSFPPTSSIDANSLKQFAAFSTTTTLPDVSPSGSRYNVTFDRWRQPDTDRKSVV